MNIWLFNACRVMGFTRRCSTGNHIILPPSLFLLFFSIPGFGDSAFCNVPGDEIIVVPSSPAERLAVSGGPRVQTVKRKAEHEQ